MHDRPRLVHARAAAREPRGAGRCAEQGEARRDEGRVSEEAFRVEHDGPRRQSRPRLATRISAKAGTAVTLGRRIARQLSKTAGVRKDVNGASPCADGVAKRTECSKVPDSRSPVV